MSLRHRIRFAASRQKPPIYPSSTILAGEPRGARLRGARLRLERLLRNYFSTDRGLLITLTIVSLCTRFYKLSRPPNVVFDELHFARFTENLLERKVSPRPSSTAAATDARRSLCSIFIRGWAS